MRDLLEANGFAATSIAAGADDDPRALALLAIAEELRLANVATDELGGEPLEPVGFLPSADAQAVALAAHARRIVDLERRIAGLESTIIAFSRTATDLENELARRSAGEG